MDTLLFIPTEDGYILMSSIVRQRVGDKIYLYESVSYRNEDGKPRNKRVPIGKIDPSTNKPIYKAEYLARMVESSAQFAESAPIKTFTVDEIRQSSILEFGAQYLFKNIAQNIGLLDAIQTAFPSSHQEIWLFRNSGGMLKINSRELLITI